MLKSKLLFVCSLIILTLLLIVGCATAATPTRTPTPTALPATPQQAGDNCTKSADAWLAKSATGKPESSFCKTDAIFAIIKSELDCGAATAKLIGPDGVPMTMNLKLVQGLYVSENYNPDKNIQAGAYTVEFRVGDTMIKTFPLTIT